MLTTSLLKSVACTPVVLAVAVWVCQPAVAAEHQVRMLNRGPDHAMQFDPELLKIAPGDTVHFVATDKGHSVASIADMTPAGTQAFSGDIGKDLTVTFTTEGIYGYSCEPHGSVGMVGMIVVGKPTNEAAAKEASVPGMARNTFKKLFQSLDAQLAGN